MPANVIPVKASETITQEELRQTRRALRLAMADVGQVAGYSWLSSRQGRKPEPGELNEVLGKSGYFRN